MFQEQSLVVQTFPTGVAIESIVSGVFRLMVAQALAGFENFSTEIAGETSTLVSSHVFPIMTANSEPLPALTTEERVLSRVMLLVLF